MELKQLKWVNQVNKVNCRKQNYPADFLMIRAYIPVFGKGAYIQNWRKYKRIGGLRTNQPLIEKDAFYFFHTNNYGGYTHKVKCTTLEEAKKMAQNFYVNLVKENFFEPPVVRKVLVEKSKKKFRKKIVRPPVHLFQGMQPINDSEMWVSAL